MHHNQRIKLSITQALLQTLSYSDIFDYPLTGDQLYTYTPIKLSLKEFLSQSRSIPHCIKNNMVYYFLPTRQQLVAARIKKEMISEEKIRHATRIARILGYFPTILFIGISGSLAMQNADKKSDSDLFFITKPHTLWITRFFVYVFLYLFGIKRKKKNRHTAICANMFMDRTHLVFPLKKRNLYTAHEIYQLMPLVNKQQTYQQFLSTNAWIQHYFPNSVLPKNVQQTERFSLSFLLAPLEYLLYVTQKWYMRKKMTRETISPTTIAFHPLDYEGMILQEYERKIKAL